MCAAIVLVNFLHACCTWVHDRCSLRSFFLVPTFLGFRQKEIPGRTCLSWDTLKSFKSWSISIPWFRLLPIVEYTCLVFTKQTSRTNFFFAGAGNCKHGQKIVVFPKPQHETSAHKSSPITCRQKTSNEHGKVEKAIACLLRWKSPSMIYFNAPKILSQSCHPYTQPTLWMNVLKKNRKKKLKSRNDTFLFPLIFCGIFSWIKSLFEHWMLRCSATPTHSCCSVLGKSRLITSLPLVPPPHGCHPHQSLTK